MYCKLSIRCCDFFICRYPVFLLVYKENSVSRELKTGMCWTNINLTKAKNAPGLALKRVLSSQGHLDSQIQPSAVSFLYCVAYGNNYIHKFYSVCAVLISFFLTEDSVLSANCQSRGTITLCVYKLYILLFQKQHYYYYYFFHWFPAFQPELTVWLQFALVRMWEELNPTYRLT